MFNFLHIFSANFRDSKPYRRDETTEEQRDGDAGLSVKFELDHITKNSKFQIDFDERESDSHAVLSQLPQTAVVLLNWKSPLRTGDLQSGAHVWPCHI